MSAAALAPAAFFDIDGTLLPPPSLERRLFRSLKYRHLIPAKNYLLWLAEAVRLAPRGWDAVRYGNKMYLRDVVRKPESLMSNVSFFSAAMERISWHASQGHAIVLASGTLEPLANGVARALEAELRSLGVEARICVWATRLGERGRRWTGRLEGDAMYAEAKERAARRVAEANRLSLADAYAYGDSASDRWLLAAVGHPAAVNPCPRLERIASLHGWPILQWREESRLQTRTDGDQRFLEAPREQSA